MSDTTPRPDEPTTDATAPPEEPAEAPDEPTSDATAATTEEPAQAPTEPTEPTAAAGPARAEAATPAEEAATTEATPPPPPPPSAGVPPQDVPAQQPYASPQQYGPPQQYGAPQQAGQLPPGQAAMTPQDERTWSMATHGITLAALLLSGGTLGFVAALVMYVVYKDRGPYIRANTANALNIQITTVIAVLLGFVLAITVVGLIIAIPLWIAAGIYALVMHILGMVKASNGEWWDPPLTPKFVR